MMMKTLFAIIALSLLVSGCPRIEVTPNPPVITDQANCSSACARLKILRCEEGTDLDMKKACVTIDECGKGQTCVDGRCIVTCTQFCTDTENRGVFLDPTCVMNITSCDQIERCPLPTKK